MKPRSKSNARKEAGGFEKSAKKQLRRRILQILGLLILVGGVVYLSQKFNAWKASRDLISNTLWNVEEEVPLRIEEMSTVDLIELAEKSKPDNSDPLPVQMAWVQERRQISSALLSREGDEEAQKNATLFRLEALQWYSNLNRRYKLGDESIDNELYQLSIANLEHPDPEIAKTANAAVMMTNIHQFVSQPDKGTLSQALETAKDTCRRYAHDDEFATLVYGYAAAMKRSELLVGTSVEFFNIVLEIFPDSESLQARQLAKASHSEILFGGKLANARSATTLLSGLKDRLRIQEKPIEKEISARLEYSLVEDMLDSLAVDQMFELLELLLTHNRVELAKEQLGKLQSFFQSTSLPERQEILDRLSDVSKRANQVDQTVDLSGLTEVATNATFEPDPELPLLLVFWTPGELKSEQLLSALYSQSIKQELQIAAVSKQNESNEELLKKYASEMPDFVFVTTTTVSESEGLLDRVPVPRFPWTLLLDADKRLTVSNSDIRDLGTNLSRNKD